MYYGCLSKPDKDSQKIDRFFFFFNEDIFTGTLPSNKFEKDKTWMGAEVQFQVPQFVLVIFKYIILD